MALLSYKMKIQTKMIIAYIALHHFIQNSALRDELFERCVVDEDYDPIDTQSGSFGGHVSMDQQSMMETRVAFVIVLLLL